MLLVMISVAIYMYIQPYQGLWTNILEVVLLGDILLMVMITSTDHFKVITTQVLTSLRSSLLQTAAVFDSDHSFSIDQCGNVDQISEHAAVLIPFYFLPIIILFGFAAKEVYKKVKGKCHAKLVVCEYTLRTHISIPLALNNVYNSLLVLNCLRKLHNCCQLFV